MLTVPFGIVVGVMDSTASTVSETVADAVFETESVTVTTMLKMPEVVGAPERTPELESTSPLGIDEPAAAAHVQL